MGATMQDYTRLKVWQKSHALTVSMYTHLFFLSPYFQQEILQTGFSAYATDPTPTIFLEHLNT